MMDNLDKEAIDKRMTINLAKYHESSPVRLSKHVSILKTRTQQLEALS